MAESDLLIKENLLAEAYLQVQNNIQFCQKKGFVKHNMIKELLNLAIIKLKSGNLIAALSEIENVKI